jgi:hypothetical protein
MTKGSQLSMIQFTQQGILVLLGSSDIYWVSTSTEQQGLRSSDRS